MARACPATSATSASRADRIVSVGRPLAEAATGHRRDGQGRGARLHRSAHALRRADLLRPVRVSRDRARHHDGRHRQLLAEPRSRACAAARPLLAHVPAHRGDARGRRSRRGSTGVGASRSAACSTRSTGNLALNVAPLVGHSVLRLDVLGDDVRRPATAEEIAAMCDLLARVPRRGRGRHVDELRRHRGGLQPGAVPLGRAQRGRGVVRSARRARPHAADRPRVLRRRSDRLPRRDARRALARATASPRRCRRCSTARPCPDACDKVMAAVEREWAPEARVWPQVQTRPIDISWTLDQRSIMFLASRLVAGALAADQANRSSPRSRIRRSARRSTGTINMLGEHPQRRPRPGGFVVREVALERNRDLVGRTLGDIVERAQRHTGVTSSSISRSRRTSARGSSAAGHRPRRRRRGRWAAGPSVRARRRQRRRRARRVVRDVRRHRLPRVAFVRETGALRLEEAVKKITSDPATIWGLPQRGAAARGVRRRRRGVRCRHARPGSGGRVRRLPRRGHPLDPPLRRDGHSPGRRRGHLERDRGLCRRRASWGARDPMKPGGW